VRYRPAVVGAPTATPGTAAPTTPTASGRQLPRTGASTLLAGFAVALMGGALLARRRSAAGDALTEDSGR
jgi:hypothetical protein